MPEQLSHEAIRPLNNPRWLPCSLLAWAGVWVFWLLTTKRFHPTFGLALIVTTTLVVAFAGVSYLNHLVLAPRFLLTGHRAAYWGWLTLAMLTGTGAALALIRLSYLRLAGPDPDPNGILKHFLIDLFGMAVHLAGAWVVATVARRTRLPGSTGRRPPG